MVKLLRVGVLALAVVVTPIAVVVVWALGPVAWLCVAVVVCRVFRRRPGSADR